MTVRAIVVFAYAVALYRLLPRRAIAGSAAIDIVLAIIVASSLSRALTGNAPLFATMAATTAIGALYYAMTAVARRSDRFASAVKGKPLPLIRDGRLDLASMRAAQFGQPDIEQHLRAEGVDELRDVRRATLERDGSVSVLR
jgi:uncharacterized membrane protein YcaP (DUF421 family)